MKNPRLLFSREEMLKMNIDTLKSRGVEIEQIAQIAYNQQAKYTDNIDFDLALESVIKIISYRDVFHQIQLGAEIDRLTEEKMFKGPIQDILYHDLGLFGLDEVFGIELSGNFGAIGRTNFGDIDVNKPGIVDELNKLGKNEGVCHTFIDDIVGAIAAAASTRIAQVINEKESLLPSNDNLSIFDLE